MSYQSSGSGIDELQRRGSAGERDLAGESTASGPNDPLDLRYGGEAVCDDQHRAAIHHAVEDLLDEALTLRLERTRRLAEKKHGPTAPEGTRVRSPRGAGPLAELCAATLRQTLDRLRHRRGGRRPGDFRFRRPGTAMADVVDHISGDERGMARHERNPRPDLRGLRALKPAR